jgi:hypothetical protein
MAIIVSQRRPSRQLEPRNGTTETLRSARDQPAVRQPVPWEPSTNEKPHLPPQRVGGTTGQRAAPNCIESQRSTAFDHLSTLRITSDNICHIKLGIPDLAQSHNCPLRPCLGHGVSGDLAPPCIQEQQIRRKHQYERSIRRPPPDRTRTPVISLAAQHPNLSGPAGPDPNAPSQSPPSDHTRGTDPQTHANPLRPRISTHRSHANHSNLNFLRIP